MGQKGFTLISVVMTAALIGFLALTNAQLQKSILGMKKSNEINLEVTRFQFRVEQTLMNQQFCTSALRSFPDLNQGLAAGLSEALALGASQILSYNVVRNGQQYNYPIAQVGSPLNAGTNVTVESIRLEESGQVDQLLLVMKLNKRVIASNGAVAFSPLGSAEKEIKIPLNWVAIPQGDGANDVIACNYNSTLEKKEFCKAGEGFFKGFNQEGFAICEKVKEASLEDNTLDVANFETTNDLGTNEVKNESLDCPSRSISSGFKYNRSGFLTKKEKYSLLCSRNPAFSKTVKDENGEEKKYNYEFASFDHEKEFETKVEKETWAHCPEGKVVSNIFVKSDADLQLNCKNVLFKSNNELRCSAEELQNVEKKQSDLKMQEMRLESEYLELDRQNFQRDFQNNGPEYLRWQQLQSELNSIRNKISALQKDSQNCHIRYVSTKETKSKIIRGTASTGFKKCPTGYFLTGAIIGNKDDFNIKCSQLAALRVRPE